MGTLGSISTSTRDLLAGRDRPIAAWDAEQGDRSGPDRAVLAEAFAQVRGDTERLADPLEPEDQVIQSMPDVSPTRWHRAHTTWFFETFILGDPAFWSDPKDMPEPVEPSYAYLFNSYYQQVGPQFPRHKRGLLSRPTCADVARYRKQVDQRMAALVETCSDDVLNQLSNRMVLGLHHEQQHQELLLMDIKHVFSENPLLPTYAPGADGDAAGGARSSTTEVEPPPFSWTGFDGGEFFIGASNGFHFDNEGPRHVSLIGDFELANRLVTSGEWLSFIEDGGYERPELWLSDGWATRCAQGWSAPLYWFRREGRWHEFTLNGPRPVLKSSPVVHVSGYEADAFARWAQARLPTEFEWERAADSLGTESSEPNIGFRYLQPRPAEDVQLLQQLIGDVWEWTSSPYIGYPRYRPPHGAIGEYNGKFMSGQMVLRGGSALTPPGHIRTTYRNFFPPHSRWMFGGLRLARDT